MIRAALILRNQMILEGKDVATGVFNVSQEERLQLRDEPPFNHPVLGTERDRLCGLDLRIISPSDRGNNRVVSTERCSYVATVPETSGSYLWSDPSEDAWTPAGDCIAFPRISFSGDCDQ